MTRFRAFCRAALLLPVVVGPLQAQAWRELAAHVGTSARVLLIGTRPEDEDNALIAWLSRGRRVETAYLSLTRGESGVNLSGAERGAQLAVVRTAELLAERERDGARQYFTRAFDMGPVLADTMVERAWPRDSLLVDIVSVIRAFRPQVVIAMTRDAGERDATRRYTARLVADAFVIAGDSARLAARETAQIPAWSASQLFTRVDSAEADARVTRIDVGEFDRGESRTYAEIGAAIRRLQRTQPSLPAPGPGRLDRLLRLDSARNGAALELFAGIDTAMTRFRTVGPAAARAHFDTLQTMLAGLPATIARGSADSVAVQLARLARRTTNVRLEMGCPDFNDIASCDGSLGDLAVSLVTIRERATRAMLHASGVVIDGVAGRELVAVGDSVAVTVTLRNAGTAAVQIRRLAAVADRRVAARIPDAIGTLAAGSTLRYATHVRLLAPSYHWWQINGLVAGTQLHRIVPATSQVATGEDRIWTSGIEATLGIGGVDVPVSVRPLVARAATALRGDVQHPVIGVAETSLLLERGAEYERAALRIDRLFRVFVSSARSIPDTLAVSLDLPAGLRADSASKTVALPPFGSRNLYFRLRGTLPAGPQQLAVSARSIMALPAQRIGSAQTDAMREFTLGTVINDYPHIPSQHFVRFARDRFESVDVRVPARLRIGYVRGSDDLRAALSQLRLDAQVVDLALLPVYDLTGITSILIGAGALRSEATAAAMPALRSFLTRGGTIVVLAGGAEIARSGLFPFPIITETMAGRPAADSLDVRVAEPRHALLHWPNVLTMRDWAAWNGDRTCSRATEVDARYRTPLAVYDASRTTTTPAIIATPVGKGMLIHTMLCVSPELESARTGAARLLVNLLSAGIRTGF